MTVVVKQPVRVLAYSHDSFGLGHIRRTLSVVSSMVAQGPHVSALCVTGTPIPGLLDLPPRCDLVKLPSITKGETGEYLPKSLPVLGRDIFSLRSDLISSALHWFRPDIFLVDHTPVGAKGELIPALKRLQEESPQTQVVLGMRDLIDSPHRVRAQMALERSVEVLRTYYDQILVYGSHEILDVGTAYELPKDLRDKLHYVGFACPPRSAGHQECTANSPQRILVSAGGGADGYELMDAVARALAGPLRDEHLLVTFVTGPLMDHGQVKKLRAATEADARVDLHRATRDMSRLVARADLIVGMAGYNTVYEALSYNRRLLVCPRSRPRAEQLYRAHRLAKLGLLSILTSEDLAVASQVATAIRTALSSHPPTAATRRLDFAGSHRAADALLSGLTSPECGAYSAPNL